LRRPGRRRLPLGPHHQLMEALLGLGEGRNFNRAGTLQCPSPHVAFKCDAKAQPFRRKVLLSGALRVGTSRYFDAAAGYNIAGPEVEAALLSHGEVRECAVIGVADCDRGQIVEAHVVLVEGVPPDEATRKRLQDHVKATIAPYKYPRSLRFVERCQKRRRARSSAFA
jgi:hypothetical protein